MASLLAEVLFGHGFAAETAQDVIEARAAIRHFDPDGILMDISLGDGPSGLDLARVLAGQRPDIAIIFLTKTCARPASMSQSYLQAAVSCARTASATPSTCLSRSRRS